jgi:hypothetical protein
MLAGISQHVYEQLESTDQLELIGENNVYLSRLKFAAAALSQAVADAQESISIKGNQSQATNIV